MTLFQTLDDKTECVGIYIDGKLQFDIDKIPTHASKTWKYIPYLKDREIEYLSLYLEGKALGDILPEYLQDDWQDISSKLQSFKRSLKIAGVSLQENCFYDLVPKRFLIEYCEVQNTIASFVETKIKKPKRYKFYKFVHMMLRDMTENRIALDKRFLKSFASHPKLRNQSQKILESSCRVDYNQFGTKTGRLTCRPGSFPILTLGKDLRAAIQPRNDYFVELDFNGAEIRTLLGILGKEQPLNDIHEFNISSVFQQPMTREQAKVSFFAWLYGAKSAVSPEVKQTLKGFYDADLLLEKYWDGKRVITPFGKKIENVSEHHALNYIIQSTAAELVLKQAVKIHHLLELKKVQTRLSFLVHDSIILDVKKEDEYLLKGVLSLFETTPFGKFKVNIQKGLNLGTMKKVCNFE